MSVKPPTDGVHSQFTAVDEQFAKIQGSQPTAIVHAAMAVAQVHATCALVHAVRELTAEIRKGRETL